MQRLFASLLLTSSACTAGYIKSGESGNEIAGAHAVFQDVSSGALLGVTSQSDGSWAFDPHSDPETKSRKAVTLSVDTYKVWGAIGSPCYPLVKFATTTNLTHTFNTTCEDEDGEDYECQGYDLMFHEGPYTGAMRTGNSQYSELHLKVAQGQSPLPGCALTHVRTVDIGWPVNQHYREYSCGCSWFTPDQNDDYPLRIHF